MEKQQLGLLWTDDYLCHKWCDPAPLDGSAPNLVITETDSQDHVFYKRAFNTQACEQLNAWIGGFESILKKMTPGNFNWFLHTMLFYDTQYVINKQMRTDEEDEEDAESDDEIMCIFPKNYIMYALYSVVAIFWNLITMLPLCNWNDIT